MGLSLFGKKSGAKVATTASPPATTRSAQTDPEITIKKLRDTIKTQEKREAHIQRKVDAMVAEAKTKMAKGDKRGALFAMKRKRMYEQEAEKITNVKMTLETQAITLEGAQQNAESFAAMYSGTKTMKQIRKDVGVERVDDIMDDMKEEMEMANEVNAAISQTVDPFITDDDELLEELMGLEKAELLPTDVSLPSVPATKLPKPATSLQKDEADELGKLEAELAAL